MSEGQLFETPPVIRTEWGGLIERPYGDSSGWSGSETSKARADQADKSGVTGVRQAETLDLVATADLNGLTWKELADETGWHHGTASGVLSVLHKTGHLARLKQTRNRCKIYVTPRNVLGRETETHGRAAPPKAAEDVLKALQSMDLPEEAKELIQVFFEGEQQP